MAQHGAARFGLHRRRHCRGPRDQQPGALWRPWLPTAVRAPRSHCRPPAPSRCRVVPRLPRAPLFDHIRQAFDNLRRSGSTWLLTTTFLDHHENVDIESGDWRILNLTRAPFNLPAPEGVLVDTLQRVPMPTRRWGCGASPTCLRRRPLTTGTQRHGERTEISGGNVANEHHPQNVCASSVVSVSPWVNLQRHQGRRERQPSMATAITMIAPMIISCM